MEFPAQQKNSKTWSNNNCKPRGYKAKKTSYKSGVLGYRSFLLSNRFIILIHDIRVRSKIYVILDYQLLLV